MRPALLALLAVFLVPTTTEAGWRCHKRWRCCRIVRCCRPCQPVHHHYQHHAPHQKSTPHQKGGSVQAAAQWRADTLAARGYGGHFALPCYGASGEGWGYGATPQQALANCCVTGSGRIAGQAVAQAAGGGYYAIKLYW